MRFIPTKLTPKECTRRQPARGRRELPISAAVLGVLLLLLAPAAGADETAVNEELLVTTEWLAGHLDDPAVVVIHVGNPGEEGGSADADGHIPGARFLPWEAVAIDREGIPNELPDADVLHDTFAALGISDGDRVVLYDNGPGLAAARAFVALDFLGLGGRAALLDGQLAKWKAEERPTSRETPVFEPGELTIKPRLETITTLAAMRQHYGTLGRSPIAPELLDSRPEAQFTGAEPGKDVTRAGHIPGAHHVYWQEHLAAGEIPVLRPVAELQKLYEEAGIDRRDPVITYCRSGGQASHSYFVLKYLGYRVSLYDGSFYEWQLDDDRPISAMQ